MPATPELTFPEAVLLFPSGDGPLITFARNVYGALLNNASFPSPEPQLSVFRERRVRDHF